MVRFPSEEWVKEFHKLINESEAYAESAKNWEGDFLFVVTPDEGLDREWVVYVDLWHGKCRNARLLKSRDEKTTAFTMEGPYSNWKKLIQGKIGPIKGILTGKFKLKGSKMKILKNRKAAGELVATAAKVPTEFV
ncbi:MAG: SCP2 sterol-binding domain-containing protein [Promethearchaeota archaeon]